MADTVSFGIITIESLWPSPVGKNKGAIEIDKSGKVKQEEAYYSSVEGTERVGADRYYSYKNPTDSAKRGYYILVALNIMSVNTVSDVAGTNTFSADFTPEKLVYISADSGYATTDDLIKSLITRTADGTNNVVAQAVGSVTSTLLTMLKKDNIQYTDIPVDQGNFNIKDLVEVGDTVSIWLYNDPKEFNFRPDVNDIAEKVPDLSPIVGNFTRMPFAIEADEITENSIVSSTGIASKAQADALSIVQNKGKEPQKITHADVMQAALDIATKAGQFDDGGGKRGTVETHSRIIDDSGYRGLTISSADIVAYYITRELAKDAYFKDLSSYVTYESSNDSSQAKTENAASVSSGRRLYYRYSNNAKGRDLTYFIVKTYQLQSAAQQFQSLKGVVDSLATIKAPLVVLNNNSYDSSLDALTGRPTVFKAPALQSQSYTAGYNILKGFLESKLKQETQAVGNSIVSTEVGKKGVGPIVDRAYLYSKQTGDSPYLVMRGHISSMSTKYGTNNSSVSISGRGYEYVMEKQTIFYENGLTIGDSIAAIQDYTSYYANLSPSQTITALITKWMPKKVKWGVLTQTMNVIAQIAGIANKEGTKEYLVRGGLVNERNLGELLGNARYKPTNEEVKKAAEESLKNDTRVFTPINYVDLTRVAEFTRSINKADASGLIVNTTAPTQLSSGKTVMQACKEIGAVGNIYELFVDETGKLIYRVTMEAWERTPNTAYTPTVDDVVSFNETETDEALYTAINVNATANQQINSGQQQLAFTGTGRAIPRPAAMPFGLYMDSDNPNLFSPELFRYGLRMQTFNDPYGADGQVMRPKAYNLLRFYKEPLKKAEVTMQLDPTYRKGNTVHVFLKGKKTRSKTVINIDDYLKWLGSVKKDPVNVQRYIGVEARFNRWTAYYKNDRNGLYSVLANLQNIDAMWSLSKIQETLEFIKNQGFTRMTPDIFPMTLWFYLANPGNAEYAKVIEAHRQVYAIILGKRTSAISDSLVPYLRYVKLNNVVSRQYYIERVTHSFVDGTAAETALSLSYGQDCITLTHPYLDVPLGFMSVERKLKDEFYEEGHKGAERGVSGGNVEDYEIPLNSVWRKLQKAQFVEDKEHKESSLIYEGARVRNGALFIHKLITHLGEDNES